MRFVMGVLSGMPSSYVVLRFLWGLMWCFLQQFHPSWRVSNHNRALSFTLNCLIPEMCVDESASRRRFQIHGWARTPLISNGDAIAEKKRSDSSPLIFRKYPQGRKVPEKIQLASE